MAPQSPQGMPPPAEGMPPFPMFPLDAYKPPLPPPPPPEMMAVFGPPGPPPTPEQWAALPHDDIGQRMVVGIWAMTIACGLVLGLRVYCKTFRNSRLWWDDFILIAAWCSLLIETAVLTRLRDLGYGKHGWDIPWYYMEEGFKCIAVAGTFSIMAAVWSKTSFAITILRLTEGKTRWFVWFVIVSMNVAMGLSALLPWVNCTPIIKSWKPWHPGTCWAREILRDYNIFSAVYSGTMDLTLAILPWKLIWGLQMKRAEKIGVAVAMSMGVIAAATAFVKVSKIPLLTANDPYDNIDLFLWGNAESSVTIIAASIPILRVLIRDVRSTMRSARSGDRKTNNTSGGGKMSTTRSGTRTTVTISGARRSSRMPDKDGNFLRMDSESDKSILVPAGGITKTDEYAVEYHRRGDLESYGKKDSRRDRSSDRGYELQPV